MSITFASQLSQRNYRWTDWKSIFLIKGFIHQYNDDGSIYTIWGYDGPEIHLCQIWKGSVPDTVISSGYTQEQNDSDKSDFVTNYLSSANSAINVTTVTGISDGNKIGNIGDRLKVDVGMTLGDDGSVITEDSFHYAAEQGNAYAHCHIHTLNNGNTYYHLIVAPDTATRIHFRSTVTSTGSGKIEIFENSVVSANGSAAAVYNRNRNSSNSPSCLMYHSPTVTSEGTMLEAENFGANGGNKQGTGSTAGELELVLKQNTKYLIKYTSYASDNKFSERQFWYEE